jgi:hypothetical protein
MVRIRATTALKKVESGHALQLQCMDARLTGPASAATTSVSRLTAVRVHTCTKRSTRSEVGLGATQNGASKGRPCPFGTPGWRLKSRSAAEMPARAIAGTHRSTGGVVKAFSWPSTNLPCWDDDGEVGMYSLAGVVLHKAACQRVHTGFRTIAGTDEGWARGFARASILLTLGALGRVGRFEPGGHPPPADSTRGVGRHPGTDLDALLGPDYPSHPTSTNYITTCSRRPPMCLRTTASGCTAMSCHPRRRLHVLDLDDDSVRTVPEHG